MRMRAAVVMSVTFSLLATSPIYAVPTTSASAITQPPISMAGINTESQRFDGQMDPAFVTLGPTEGLFPEFGFYPSKIGINYRVALNAPILAPLNSKFIGFNNRNADARNGMDGTLQVPFDDLQLCFESTSKEWPGLIYCFYHLKNSPLLQGINKTKLCSNSKMWPGKLRAGGRQFYPENDLTRQADAASNACGALLGKKLKRGDVIAYAGAVGNHSQAPIMVKVFDESVNPTVNIGDPYLHWVQADRFFYWKCFAKTAKFEPGVLAYPFECGGYRVEKSERSLKFKYLK